MKQITAHFNPLNAIFTFIQLLTFAYPICVYFTIFQYYSFTLVIHSGCICGKALKHSATGSQTEYVCECGRHFDIRVVPCKLCGNLCVGILRPGMSASDMCRLCGADHQMPESALTIRQTGLGAMLRRSFILRLAVVAVGIGVVIAVINVIKS